ncbi:MAG: hypothetical protein NW200_06965 [Hyphomonadaceae bacterium]|nr:hypothetical protein [Hyphomonadaceae bacterium]
MTTDGPRMDTFARRSLTAGERAIARGMFGREIDVDAVRIQQIPPAPFAAMVPHRRTILFSMWRAARDFTTAAPGERGWFVHELAHVWQARRGVVLAAAKLKALGRDAYAYRFEPGKPFAYYNIEQQAEIARHLYLHRIGEPDARAPSRANLEALWPINSRPGVA